jgi:hypothetical protein
MELQLKLGLRGKSRFFVLDEFGNIERGRGGVPVYRNESGFLKKAGDFNKNLITNRGMNECAVRTIMSATLSSNMRYRLKVGTGSSSPAVTDTQLESYVGETFQSGGFPQVQDRFEQGDNLIWESECIRVFEAGSPITATEYGFDNATGNNASIRELLRDAENNPTGVSIPTGKKLRVDHTMEIITPKATLQSLTIKEFDAGNNEVDEQIYNVTIRPIFSSVANSSILEPFGNPTTVFVSSSRLNPSDPLASVNTSPNSVAQTTTSGWTALTPAYTEGSFQKKTGAVLLESLGNSLDIATFGLATSFSGNSLQNGFLVTLDSPQILPKDADHIYEFLLVKTWARV